jgi:hypothetical protein
VNDESGSYSLNSWDGDHKIPHMRESYLATS